MLPRNMKTLIIDIESTLLSRYKVNSMQELENIEREGTQESRVLLENRSQLRIGVQDSASQILPDCSYMTTNLTAGACGNHCSLSSIKSLFLMASTSSSLKRSSFSSKI